VPSTEWLSPINLHCEVHGFIITLHWRLCPEELGRVGDEFRARIRNRNQIEVDLKKETINRLNQQNLGRFVFLK
jgi:hypothetical protein